MADDKINDPLEVASDLPDNTESVENSAPTEQEPHSLKKKKGFFSRSTKGDVKKDASTVEAGEEIAENEEKAPVVQIDPVVELEQKLADANDKFLRLFSDFDNFRKRTAREKIEASKAASSDLLAQLLPIVDDFERALRSMEPVDETIAPLRQGVELIYNKFWSIIERQGVKAIEAIGMEFTTDFHEALTSIPVTDESQKGKVVDQVEKGYMLGDKVIRFAKVIVGA
ncbi:MAG TPA: nucleotide exchange factor GrpE [Bacteroidales bacterium]|nr:MAG: nucleotide exchange factor GrpE [Bacteroidetes bacterium HGW-Bacteroidetes-22]HAQ65805.1 nucleotide exchange factor GrpE [Bacteroidales bacterium]HBZ67031.1 nucleotide exchange factor GrpE [Bacteroidales bacterium]